jgi:DNA polymerase
MSDNFFSEEAPSPQEVKKQIRTYLEFLRRVGFLYLVPDSNQPRVSAHHRAECLEKLKVEAVKCTKCPLCETRTHVVFGAGNKNADLLFVGEAPGKDEDEQGLPFVGRSGKLLGQMLKEVGIERSNVYIGNVIKCRPPDNRDPKPEEIETCEPYLLGQIDFIQPKVIVTLGRFAAQTLTGQAIGITRMRGSFYDYHGVKLMPTLHPAAVLRNMNYHSDVLSDLRKAAEAAG